MLRCRLWCALTIAFVASQHPLRALVLPVYTPAALFSTSAGVVSSVLVLSALYVGFSEASASAIAGLMGIIAVVFSPPTGRVIVRIGDRRALLLAGCFGTLAAAAIFAVMMTAGGGISRVLFIAAIVALGLASNVWQLARQAYVAQSVPAMWRARALSTLGGMNRVGSLVGPLISTSVVALWWLGGAYAASIILLVAATFIVARFLVDGDGRPSTSVSVSESRVPSQAATVIMGVTMNGVAILRAIFPVVIPLWGTFLGASETLITSTFAATALLDTVMFMLAGGLMDRWGRHAAIGPTLLIMPLGLIVMALFHNIPGYIVGAVILGFGNGFGAGTVMTVGADLSPQTAKASFLGIWQSIVNIGGAAGPFIVSGLTHAFGIESALWVIAAMGLGCAAWMFLTIRRAYSYLGRDLRGLPLER